MCWVFFCIFQMWLVVTLDIYFYGVGIWSKSYHLVIHYLVNPVRRATTKICTCPDFSMVMWCNFELWMMDISVRLMDSNTHLHWAVFFFCDHCLLCVYFGMDHEQDWGSSPVSHSLSSKSPHPAIHPSVWQDQSSLACLPWSFRCSTSGGGRVSGNHSVQMCFSVQPLRTTLHYF